MVINIKHFIITIIAIFLSLGIGIFIGVIIDSQQLFIDQQKVLVTQIEEEFHGFKQKNYELMNRLEEYRRDNVSKDKFLDIAYYNLSKGSLRNQNVMIINMFTENDYLDMDKIFNSTGVNRIVQAIIPKESDNNIKNIVKELNNKAKIENKYDEMKKAFSEKVDLRLLMGEYSLLPFYLKSIDGIDYRGDIYTNIDYIILIDDGFKINDKAYKIVREKLINFIKDNNIPLIAIEKSNTNHSSMSFYKELGISTVDNVDTKLGQIAMLMVLNGKKGHFGEKVTADCLIPEDVLNFNID